MRLTMSGKPGESGTPGLLNLQIRIGLLAIFLLAFGLRLMANIQYEGLHTGPSLSGFGADGDDFNRIAANLVERHEYSVEAGEPTSFRAPGFPIFLAAVYQLFGINNFPAARVSFCLIGALLAVIVFFLAREFVDAATALAAAALVAIYPNLIYYNIHFASEPLYTLLLTASVWMLARGVDGRASQMWRPFVASGLLLGLAALTRPVAVSIFPFFALAVLCLKYKDKKRMLLGAALVGSAMFLTIAPWTARNYVVHQRFALIASNGGSTFWGGNNEIVLQDVVHQGDWVTTNSFPEQKSEVTALANEIDRDQLEWQYGKQFLAAHKADVPRLLWYKVRAFLMPLPASPNKMFNLIIGLSYSSMIPFMLFGIWIFVRKNTVSRNQLILLCAPIAATALSILIFYGSSRFRCTIEPFLIIVAASAITECAAWAFSRWDHSHTWKLKTGN